MKFPFPFPRHLVLLLIIVLNTTGLLFSQPEVVDAVNYKQITHFETDMAITTMKMSADGSKIIFATGGPMVKVFTIDADGTDLLEIYDFQRTGFGPTVDISASGEKVIWCDGEGEIFIANSDGTGRDELATLIPNPDTNFADLEPIIPLPPRITADGSQVFFIHMGRDPRASGVWKVNSDNSSLAMEFNYLKVARDVFGRDGSEYNYNVAFTDGFDISADGSRVLFGTRIFKLEDRDMTRGDAIMAFGTELYDVGEFALGNQPFSIDPEGGFALMYRLELNPGLEYEEINVYFVPFGTGDPVKVIEGLDIFGSSAFTQMSFNGSTGITMAGNGRMPINLVDRVTGSRLDLVTLDGISIAIGGWRLSEAYLPSINADGDRFCFLAPSFPPQIWMGSILADGLSSQPKISGVQFSPDYVLYDASTSSTIEALVSDLNHPPYKVTFESFQNGYPYFRALRSQSPQNGFLVDDGTFGDAVEGDGRYTNNTVTIDLLETPVGNYTVRIGAVNSSLEDITMVDVESLSIVEESTSTPVHESSSFILYPNYPNPFTGQTNIRYVLPNATEVQLEVFNALGQKVSTLVKEKQSAGDFSTLFDGTNLAPGIYFYQFRAGPLIQTLKMELSK